jgi:hypothetical protein
VQLALTGCVQTLDIYHACQHLHRAAQGVFGEGAAATKTAFQRGRHFLLAQGWAGVCVWVSELLAVENDLQRDRRRRFTDRVIGYFSKHLDRLNYAEGWRRVAPSAAARWKVRRRPGGFA